MALGMVLTPWYGYLLTFPSPAFPFHTISTPLRSSGLSCALLSPAFSHFVSFCCAHSSSSFGSCLDFGLHFLREAVLCLRWVSFAFLCIWSELSPLRDSLSVACAAVHGMCPLHLAQSPTHSRCLISDEKTHRKGVPTPTKHHVSSENADPRRRVFAREE